MPNYFLLNPPNNLMEDQQFFQGSGDYLTTLKLYMIMKENTIIFEEIKEKKKKNMYVLQLCKTIKTFFKLFFFQTCV